MRAWAAAASASAWGPSCRRVMVAKARVRAAASSSSMRSAMLGPLTPGPVGVSPSCRDAGGL
eukprot:6644359-Pyramimonas_sp.AAC.1